MSKGKVLSFITGLFSKAFDVDLTLANGDIVTVETEAETPQVGDKVTQKTDGGQETGQPMADGEYLLKDERTLIIEGGAIKEIKEKASSEESDAGGGNASQEEFNSTVKNDLETLANEVIALRKENASLKSEFARIKEMQSHYQVGDSGGVSSAQGKGSEKLTLEEIRERQGSYKK